MNEYVFEIILGIIGILGTVLTGIVVPYIKEKVGNEKLSKYKEWTALAVKSAEMIFNEQGMGETKKEYVVNFLNEMFNKNKVVITPQQIEILLEAAVKAMKIDEGND